MSFPLHLSSRCQHIWEFAIICKIARSAEPQAYARAYSNAALEHWWSKLGSVGARLAWSSRGCKQLENPVESEHSGRDRAVNGAPIRLPFVRPDCSFCESFVPKARPCAPGGSAGPLSCQRCSPESFLGAFSAVRQCGAAHTRAHLLCAVPAVLCERQPTRHHAPAAVARALL